MAWALLAVLVGSLLAATWSRAFGSDTPDDALSAAEPFGVSVEQDGLAITATASGVENVVWKNRLIDVGDSCSPETFAVTPNNPAVTHSNRRMLPDSAEAQNYYRNRFVCFEAAPLDTYSWPEYALWRIDLGHPSLVVRQDGVVKWGTYLRAVADENVTYRLLKYEAAGIGGGGYPVAGSGCESLFRKPSAGFARYARIIDVGPAQERIFWANAWSDSMRFCLEATDDDGNTTYVYVSKSAGTIRINQWRDELRAYLRSSAATIDWEMAGPFGNADCDASLFGRPADRRQTLPAWKSFSLIPPSSSLRVPIHYCFRATDSLGHISYQSVKFDNQPPVINVEQAGDTLTITANEPILNFWTVGPLESGEFEDCAAVFERDESGGHVNDLFWRGDRVLEIEHDSDNASAKYYCIEIEDRVGNRSVLQYQYVDLSETI